MKNTSSDQNTEPIPTELDLSHKVINRTLTLADAFKILPPKATFINFSGNEISFQVFSIVDALKGTAVTAVNFTDNDIAERASVVVHDLKNTRVIAVNLSGNNTTFKIDLECLYNALIGGHIRKLGLTHKERCSALLKESIQSLIRKDFEGQGYDESLACPVDLIFPKEIEMLIGEYIIPTIDLNW
jgi:hypothetical protein